MDFEQELLSLARQHAEEAEVYSVNGEETPVAFEANRLKGVSARQSFGVALRIIQNGRIGLAAGSGPERPQDLLDIALETAPFGAQAHFHLPGPGSYTAVDVFDPATAALSLEALAEGGQRAIDQIAAHTPGILCEAGLTKRESTVRLLNSAGLDVRTRRTSFSARIEGTVVTGTDMLFVGDMVASCHPVLDLSKLVDTTLRQLEWAKTTVAAPHGQLPVIFTPRALAQSFVTPLSLGLSGKTVLQGASPLGQRLGEQCFDPRIGLTDDPTIPFCVGAQAFDGEGVPSHKQALVEDGIVRRFVYDLQTAGMANTQSTGNGGRVLNALPSPDINVLVMGTGDVSLEDMIGGIDQGLLVEEMIGSGQGNVLGGDFSGNVLLGYRIEQGKVTGRVKDTMVAGNVYALLNNVRSLENKATWVGGSLLLPHLCFNAVAVATTT